MPRPRFVENCLDVHVCQKHCWVHHTPSVSEIDLLPTPADVDNLSCWLHPCKVFHHHTGHVPLRHDTCERYRSATSDSLLWFCVRFSQENQFHNLPRAGSIHLAHKALLETPRFCVDLLPRQNLDHLAHHCILWCTDFVVAHFCPGFHICNVGCLTLMSWSLQLSFVFAMNSTPSMILPHHQIPSNSRTCCRRACHHEERRSSQSSSCNDGWHDPFGVTLGFATARAVVEPAPDEDLGLRCSFALKDQPHFTL